MTTAPARLPPSAISIWKRPGYLGVALLVRAAIATLVALAFSGIVGASGVGAFPRGDALLFEDGALYLLELLRLSGPELSATVGLSSALLGVGFAVNLVVLGALLVAFGSEGRLPLGAALARAVSVFPTFFALGALILLAQSLLLLGASLFGTAIQSAALDERSLDLATLAGTLVLALGAVVLGSVLDVARAAAVRYELGAKKALLFALDAARRSPLAALLGWLPFASAGAALVLLAALATMKIDVSAPGTGRLLLVAAVHQLTLAALLVLRALWLARALRLVSRHEPSRRLGLLLG